MDTEGCVWLRVEIGSQIAWAAALGPDGVQVCDAAAGGDRVASGPAPATAEIGSTAEADGETLSGQTPEAAATAPEAEMPSVPLVKTRRLVVPRFPAPGHYLQVGAFAEAPNAARTVALLQAAGFGVLKSDQAYRGGTLRTVYAGPFETRAAAETARAQVRPQGYPDAFIWSVP